MRISDWSSDVCSSDLAAGIMLLGGMIDMPRLEMRRVAAPVLDEGVAHRSLLLRTPRTGFRLRARSCPPCGRPSGRIHADRQSGAVGKGGDVRDDPGGGSTIKKKTNNYKKSTNT